MTRNETTLQNMVARYGAKPSTHSASCAPTVNDMTASNHLNITRTSPPWI
jgi:hypothetical protein